MAGGQNCLSQDKIPYPKISKEEILKQSPQVIIVLSANSGMTSDALEKERKLWAELGYINAVKNQRVHVLDGDYLFVPGPRISKIAREFQGLLFPDQKGK